DEQRRRRELDAAVSLDEYLQRLELEVDVSHADDRSLPRVAQLTQRTNQFNLSLRRRTLDELRALSADAVVLVVGARDRFGDYGLVGASILRGTGRPDYWELDTFLMSCRALGRGVEDAFLHDVAAVAAERGGTTLRAPHTPGQRNGQVRDFLARTGFHESERD